MPVSTKPARPLSPHLQVYRPQLTSIMSIVHRATGVWLAMGLPVFVYWLAALADPSNDFYKYFVENLNYGLGELAVFFGAVFVLTFILYRLEMMVLARVDLKSATPWVKAVAFVLDLAIAIFLALEGFAAVHDKAGDTVDTCTNYIGLAMLFGWTWSFLYHFCTGIRHLLWDAGFFLNIRAVYISGWIALGISTVLTATAWARIMEWVSW